MSRFLGFLEGRLKITIPDWWEKTMVSSFCSDDEENQTAIYSLPKKIYSFEKKMMRGIPEKLRINAKKHSLDVIIDGRFSSLDGEGPARRIAGGVACDTQGHLAYVAVFSDFPSDYLITCVDLTSGKVVWKSVVWTYALTFSGPTPLPYVEIVCFGDRVAVFGGEHDGYVNVFEAKAGKVLGRFSTTIGVKR